MSTKPPKQANHPFSEMDYATLREQLAAMAKRGPLNTEVNELALHIEAARYLKNALSRHGRSTRAVPLSDALPLLL